MADPKSCTDLADLRAKIAKPDRKLVTQALDPNLVETLWRHLIGGSILGEERGLRPSEFGR